MKNLDSIKSFADIPPKYDIKAETNVLNAMLKNSDNLYEGCLFLKSEDFYMPKHKIIFDAFVFFRENPKELSYSSLVSYLNDKNLHDAVGGHSGLADIFKEYYFSGTFPFWLKKVKRNSTARSLISLSKKIAFDSHDRFEEIESVLSEAQSSVLELSEKTNPHTIYEHEKLVDSTLEELRMYVYEDIKPQTGIFTGIDKLDKYTGGMRPCEFWVVAARTSVGKSILAIQLARNGALQAPIGVISLEMSKEEITLRNLASVGICELSKIRDYTLSTKEYESLKENCSSMKKLPIKYQDCPSLSANSFRAAARRLKQQFGCKLIIVDYLQRLRSEDKNMKRWQEVAEVSWSMKTCAMELQIPIVALAQLNRKAEENEEPELHHLREAGDIEQDADTVIMLYRHGEQTKTQFDNFEYPTMLKIAKQRNGACVAMNLIMEGKYCRFYEEGKPCEETRQPLINPEKSRFID